jgi:hypothetical protein
MKGVFLENDVQKPHLQFATIEKKFGGPQGSISPIFYEQLLRQ